MVKNNFKLLLIFIFFLPLPAEVFAQVNRYVVYLSDKDEVPFSVDEPEEYLSERAIERRKKQGIAITQKDFPVKAEYIQQLRDAGVKVFFKSRWFNAVLVEADETQIPQINEFPFTTKVELVAHGSKLSETSTQQTSPVPFTESTKSSTYNTQVQNKMLGTDFMHSSGFKGENILIGVFDGGFANVHNLSYFKHLYDNNKVKATFDFVKNDPNVYRYSDHGTMALSCIAGLKPGQFYGTAYNADFILCVTEETATEYRVEEYNWLFAAEYADSAGVDVISTSLGYSTFDDASMNYTYNDLNGKTAVISKASAEAAARGIVLVTSAGNEGAKTWKYISAPADADHILSVGAVDLNFNHASFSSMGPTPDGRLKPDVAALGFRTTVVDKNGDIRVSNGTSFSAPLLTGFVAGYWQANPHLTARELIAKVKEAGHNAAKPNYYVGHGVPNFKTAQGYPLNNETIWIAKKFSIYPNPVRDGRVYIKKDSRFTEKDLIIRILDDKGTLINQQEVLPPPNGNILPYDVSLIPSGVYFLNIISNDVSEVVKFIKI